MCEKLEKAGGTLQQKRREIDSAKEDIARGGKECEGMEKELAEIEARRAKELAKGGKVQHLTEAVNELERELVKVKTQLEIKESTVADDAKRVEAAKKSVKDVSEDDESSLTTDRGGTEEQARGIGGRG